MRDEIDGRCGLRALSVHDLPAIMKVQEACHGPSLIEPEGALLSKMLLFSMGAWGCFSDDELVAYMICIPAAGDEVAPWGRPTISLPSRPDRLYIHDLAVQPECRGQGIASTLVRKAEEIASWFGRRYLALVSVQGTERFWTGQGFEPVREQEYVPGVPSTYMIKAVSDE